MAAGDPMSPFGGPLAKDRESRLVGALRSEVRSMREERLELEARVQGLQLRSSTAEWERDQLRSRLEEMEAAWEQHRRALRREVTTRVKVGLDYGEGRGGLVAGAGVPQFPQEVLQAVVRGAVDQSVECALGTGAMGGSGGSGPMGGSAGVGGGGASTDAATNEDVEGLYGMVRDALHTEGARWRR